MALVSIGATRNRDRRAGPISPYGVVKGSCDGILRYYLTLQLS